MQVYSEKIYKLPPFTLEGFDLTTYSSNLLGGSRSLRRLSRLIYILIVVTWGQFYETVSAKIYGLNFNMVKFKLI
jgi:hypothetical protein